MTKRAACALATLICIASVNCALAQEPGVVTGTLSDPTGAAVPNSVIELRRNAAEVGPHEGRHKSPHKKTLTIFTDEGGRFSVKLFPGAWDVFAYRNGFAPTCTLVYVEGGTAATVDLKFPKYVPMSLSP